MRISDDQLLARLVAFDSTSRESILPIADFICNYADRLGVEITRLAPPEEGKVNLLLRAGPAPDERRSGLVLSGHMDVVPAREPQWRSNPFELTDAGDRWIARGTSDMKGFLALAVNRFAALDPAKLAEPLLLLLTYDEEIGTLGAHRFVSDWPSDKPLPEKAIVGEPTSNCAVRMHKGHMQLRIVAGGRSAHSGYPHLGLNAIEKGARIVEALGQLRRALERERDDSSRFFPQVPFVPLNIGVIRGGSAINIVPDRCQIDVGVRLLPGMPSAAVVQRIEECVKLAEPESVTVAVISDSPPMLLPDTAPIYQVMTEIAGHSSAVSVAFATDAGWLQTIGMQCVLCGPGSIEVAHRPNEYILKRELVRAGEILDAAIDRMCR